MDFSDFRRLAQVHIQGIGSAKFDLSGPYGQIEANGQLSLRDFEFWNLSLGVVEGRASFQKGRLFFPGLVGQKGKTPYAGQIGIKFLASGLRLDGSVVIAKGRTEDVVSAISHLHPRIKLLQDVLDGNLSGRIEIHSPLDALEGTIGLELSDTLLAGRPLGKGVVRLRFDRGEALVLETLNLKGALGETQAEGSFSFDGPLDYRFSIKTLSLEKLLGVAAAEKYPLNGRMAFVGTIGGDAHTPIVAAYLTSPRIQLLQNSIGATQLELRIRGEEFQIYGQPFDHLRMQLKGLLSPPYTYEGQLRVTLPELKAFLPASAVSQGLNGSISATVSGSGRGADLALSRWVAQVDRLTLSRSDFTSQSQSPVSITYKNGHWEMSSLKMKGPNTEFTVEGHGDASRLTLDLQGALDMRLLESFFPSVERSAGRVDVSAEVGGTWSHPSLAGDAEIVDAKLSLRDQPLSFRNLSGRLEFSQTRLLIQDVRGVCNNGKVSMRGVVQWDGLNLKKLELATQLEEVAYRPVDYLPLTLTGGLLLQGRPNDWTLAGDLDIPRLRYQQSLDFDSMLKQISKPRAAVFGNGEKPKEWLNFDVNLRTGSDVKIDNNLAKAQLKGRLKLTGTNLRPGLLGTIETEEGGRAFFRNNQFVVNQGLLEFKDRRSLEALFDVRAETQVRQYLLRVHAFGPFSKPQILLTSEPDLSESDIISLLTLGVLGRERGTTAGAGAGLAAEALFSASGMDKQVQRFLSKSPVLKDVSFSLSTTYNDVTGVTEPSAKIESTFLTDRLKLEMIQPVLGHGRKAQAEYQMGRRVSARAQWDQENSDYNFGNLGLELKLRWESD